MKLRLLQSGLLAIALGAGTLTASAQTAPAEPKREFRSSWVAAMGIDWPKSTIEATAKQQLINYLDKLKAANFTGACIHVRPNADALYKSTLEPWSADVSGTRGKDPGWDPLEFAVEECHKRGLECYAWVNPYRVTARSHTYNTDFDKQWKANGWLISYGSWTSFNPGDQGARRHCLDAIKEIYTNYNIDGMLFDDYFYPGDGMPENSTADDWKHYKESKTKLSIADWRRQNVNTFVKELYDEIQAVRPDMRFGIGPAGVSHTSAPSYNLPYPDCNASDWQYDKIYADALAWLSDGSIDFISPQLYWETTHSTNPYDKMTQWWSMVGDHFNRHMYVSQASYKAIGDSGWGNDEIGEEVDINRSTTLNNSAGTIYYNTNSLMTSQDLVGYLARNKYTRTSLVPMVDWKTHVTYGAVSSLTNNAGTLSWQAMKTAPKTIMRYTVYAVPTGIAYKDAQAADGDGIDGKYLAGITYGTSYTLPADKRSGHWYAVCVYDGYGREYEPALLGVQAGQAEAAGLISPAEGATVSWVSTFDWSAVTDATYTLEVSEDPTFSTLLYQKWDLTAPGAQIEIDDLADGTRCYWRVITHVPGCLNGYSQVRSFLSPRRTAAVAAQPLSPADGADIEGVQVDLQWKYSGEAPEQVTVEVSPAADFSTTSYSASFEGTVTQTRVYLRTLGLGTSYWRVTTSGKLNTPTVSAVSHFNITDINEGSEPGYVRQFDPASYDTQDKLTVSSLWYRSVQSPFDNMTFEENGTLNRGMAANADGVYVSGRSSNSSSASAYLDKYDPNTGERIRRIELAADATIDYYPCNDVFTDSKGNVCIANLSLNLSTTPIVIHMVNLDDGSLTEVARLTGSTGRVDHVGVYGDVTSGNFTVFAAVSNTKSMRRWQVTDGTPSVTSRTITNFYPSGASGWGTAPRVHPVSNTQVYVDGGNTAWSLYEWQGRQAVLKGSFAQAPALAPEDCTDNGGAVFRLGDKRYSVHNVQYSENGSTFAICEAGDADDFSGMKQLWRVPKGGLGTVASGSCSAPVAATNVSPGVAHVYIYSPGNGLAAYEVVDHSISAVDEIKAQDSGMRVEDLKVIFTAPQNAIVAYTIAGVQVAAARAATELTLPASGTYIIKADGKSKLVYVR